MPTYYVGSGGNDGNTGLSWAQRKLTLNGAEDIPVAAGDTVYVGPGVYREVLTVDVSGGAGSPITYIGDYSGANTDSVGGVVRVTGSNNDQTATRANCIIGSAKDYRTFRGFLFGQASGVLVQNTTGINWIIDECLFQGTGVADSVRFVNSAGVTDMAATVQNCAFMHTSFAPAIAFGYTDATTSTNLVQNCLIIGTYGLYNDLVRSSRVGGITIKNCCIWGGNSGVRVDVALPGGYTAVSVINSLIVGASFGLRATVLGEIIENYNAVYACVTARTNVAVGANSVAYPPLFDTRWFFELVNGGNMVSPFDLASYSQLINVAGTSPTATDMRGTAAIGGVREWGPLEYDVTLDIEAGSGGAVSISPWRGGMIG